MNCLGFHSGAAALLASTDLDELIRLSDRIVVIAGGVAVAEGAAAEFGRRELVSLMNSTPTDRESSVT